MSVNPAQQRQNQCPCEIIVKGAESAQAALSFDLELEDISGNHLGKSNATAFECAQYTALMQGCSLERSMLYYLMSLGYEIEELEVEFDEDYARAWGGGTWYREHPNYHTEIPAIFAPLDFEPKFFYATFATERAGDKTFNLYSQKIPLGSGILFRKSIVYRRAVLSRRPKLINVAA